MSRPKGSKNKVKDENLDEKPIPPDPKKCSHKKERHFGGPFAELGGWCHEVGCECMRYSNCQS